MVCDSAVCEIKTQKNRTATYFIGLMDDVLQVYFKHTICNNTICEDGKCAVECGFILFFRKARQLSGNYNF